MVVALNKLFALVVILSDPGDQDHAGARLLALQPALLGVHLAPSLGRLEVGIGHQNDATSQPEGDVLQRPACKADRSAAHAHCCAMCIWHPSQAQLLPQQCRLRATILLCCASTASRGSIA